MSEKEQFQRVRTLIQAKRYDEARKLLRSIDHPKAVEWLEKLDELSPPVTASPQAQASTPITDNTLPMMGVVIMLIAVIVGGVTVGAGLHFSGRFFYLICFSPLLAAMGASLLLGHAVMLGKVRDGLVVILLGVLMGVIAYGSARYGDYLWFIETTQQEVPGVTRADVNQMLQSETGSGGFIGFLKFEAQVGLIIDFGSDYAPEEGEIQRGLPESLTVMYWGVELLIMTIAPAVWAQSRTKLPFCIGDNQWMKWNLIGRVEGLDAELFLRAFQSRDYHSAVAYISKRKSIKRPCLIIEAGDCGPHTAMGMVRVKALKYDSRGRADDDMILVTGVERRGYNTLTDVLG